MKIKHYVIIALFFISISFLIIKMQFMTNPPEKTLSESFGNSGAKVVSSEISFRGRINSNKYGTVDELKRLVLDLSKELGIADGELSSKVVKNDIMEGIELYDTINANRNISISAMNSKLADDMDGSYVSLSIVDNSVNPGLEEIRDNVLHILGKYGIKPKINTCMTGCNNGKLDSSKLNNICTNIFKKADARKVEGIREENLISVSAYTPTIGEAVNVNGNKVNLNFAVRYNSYENKTYIWLATPVITTEY